MNRNDVLNMKDPPDDWKDTILNSGIMAGVAFFSTLGSITAAGIRADPATSLIAAGIAAGANFFITLAIQRGLRKAE